MTQWENLLDTVIDTINSTILRGWSYRYTKQELLIMHTTSKRRNIVALAPVVGETPHFWFVKLSVLLHFFFWTLHLLLHPSHVMFENPPQKNILNVQFSTFVVGSPTKPNNAAGITTLHYWVTCLSSWCGRQWKKLCLQAVRFPKNDELGFHFVVIYITKIKQGFGGI